MRGRRPTRRPTTGRRRPPEAGERRGTTVRVVVTGAGGTIGSALCRALLARGDTVTGISRGPAAQPAGGVAWVAWDGLAGAVAGADAVVHLAGADVTAKRWSAARKQELRDSRIATAQRITAAIRAGAAQPTVLVSASAVGYYGSRSEETLGESASPGSDFLAHLCRDWEDAAAASGVRTVQLRFGVILARHGGALPKLLLPFRLGLGGPIGRGRQFLSWVHIDDAVGAILHAIDTDSLAGAVNVVAPQALTNAHFSRTLARALHRPALLPLPPLLLRLRLGEGASVLTASQRALPERLTTTGYHFRYPALDAALRDLLA